jgi:hypothetical protein
MLLGRGRKDGCRYPNQSWDVHKYIHTHNNSSREEGASWQTGKLASHAIVYILLIHLIRLEALMDSLGAGVP